MATPLGMRPNVAVTLPSNARLRSISTSNVPLPPCSMRARGSLAVIHGSCSSNIIASVLTVCVTPPMLALATSTIGQVPRAALALALNAMAPVVFSPPMLTVPADRPGGSHSARIVIAAVKSLSRTTRTGSSSEPLRTIGTLGASAATSNGVVCVTATGNARTARVS